MLHGEEPLHISLDNPRAITEALELLSDYHQVNYGYEEDVLPESAFHIRSGLRRSVRRPVSLSFTLDPQQDLATNLESLRQAIEDQEINWAVRAQVMIIDDIAILVISDADRDDDNDGTLGLARPRRISGSYTADELVRVLANTQQLTLQEMGISLRPLGIFGQLFVRSRPRGVITGEWDNPREGAVALIQHVQQDRGVRSGYQFRATGGNILGQGYWYGFNVFGRDEKPQYPTLRTGGRFIHRYGEALDLASAQLLAENGALIFVARQRPAVLDVFDTLTGADRDSAMAGEGGISINSVSGALDWRALSLRFHLLPGKPLAEALEGALNNDRKISDGYGPIQIVAHAEGGHALYFGPGAYYNPGIHGVRQSFAQQIPAMHLTAGISLAAAVERLYQALPETPKQALTLAAGTWQGRLLAEDLSLNEGAFGSVVCDLFSAVGLPSGILRVHYDLEEHGYQFTYHASNTED
ncbi:MAG: hypothetical protein EA401_14310 [Planctomycetota bacterium]|nr:MAG: hypothetical protein EA401_14310 [Planctomycetota bacterium]